jgi:hypothetical protein
MDTEATKTEEAVMETTRQEQDRRTHGPGSLEASRQWMRDRDRKVTDRQTAQNPSPSDINDWDFEEGPFSPPPFKQEEEPMFTIIDSHTNESVKVRSEAVVELLSGDDAQWDRTNEQLEAEAEPVTTEGDPVLFDTELEAANWAADQRLDGRRYAIVAVEDVLNQRG